MANYHEVFPDVVPPFKPRINLIVELSEGTLLSRGNTFKPTQVSSVLCTIINSDTCIQASIKPSVQYHVRGNRWYSLVMLDPGAYDSITIRVCVADVLLADFPSRTQPLARSWVHWFVYVLDPFLSLYMSISTHPR